LKDAAGDHVEPCSFPNDFRFSPRLQVQSLFSAMRLDSDILYSKVTVAKSEPAQVKVPTDGV